MKIFDSGADAMRTILVVPNHAVYSGTYDGEVVMAVNANEMSVVAGLSRRYQRVVLATYSYGSPDGAPDMPRLVCGERVQCRPLGVWRQSWRGVQKMVAHLRSVGSLLAISRSVDDVYIYTPNTFGTLFGLILAVAGRPFALYVRGGLESQGAVWVVAYRLLVRKAKFCLCTGEWLRRRVEAWGGKAGLVSPMMPYREIDAPREVRDVGKTIRLLFVGAMIASKGIFDLLLIAKELKGRGLSFQLTVIGEGPEPETHKFRQMMRQLAIEDVVSYRGYIADKAVLRQVFIDHDVFVLPSLYNEGFPRVFFEAMLFGECVVTYRRDQYRGILLDGVNCVTVEGSDPQALCDAVLNLARDTVQLNDMRVRAQRTVVEYLRPFADKTHADQVAERFANPSIMWC
ncbi:MAG: glycosyltransferase family 4 protein [Chromatiales bacterium]|nr:glycosyltransferase family 4 protein [Chromatiales bacterium]